MTGRLNLRGNQIMPRGISLGSEVSRLYSKRLSDQEIADNVGAHKKSIARWRRLRNLPSNVKQGRPKGAESMKSDLGARTYGIKLREPIPKDTIKHPVINRKIDTELYRNTGEIKYLDEVGVKTENINFRANAKKMRGEIATLEQFEAVGSYSDVAKRYQVSKTTAHSHLLHLRHLKELAEKEMVMI